MNSEEKHCVYTQENWEALMCASSVQQSRPKPHASKGWGRHVAGVVSFQETIELDLDDLEFKLLNE